MTLTTYPADQFKEPFAEALAQYGHAVADLVHPTASPIALARRRGIPESHLTGAFQLINYPIAQDAQREPNTPNLYIGLYQDSRVYAGDDPFDEEAQDFAGGPVAFHPQAPGTPPPALSRPVITAPEAERPMRTIMDALHVLGFGEITPTELTEPNFQLTLLQTGRITHEQLAQAYARYANLQYIDPKRNPPHTDVRGALSSYLINNYKIIPYSKDGNTLTVLVSDPTDTYNLVAVQDEAQHLEIKVAVASAVEIDQLLRTLYRRADQDEQLRREASERPQFTDDAQSAADPNNPVTQRIHGALEDAVANEASDVHFQPERGGVMIRERVHGNLIPRGQIPSALAIQLINQLKMMSGMSIESRVPQDKRLNLPMTIRGAPQLVRLRVSSLPSQHGDSVVMRVLPEVHTLPALDATGFSPANLALLQQATEAANGMILVTGPTGSGKTTLMHTILRGLNDHRRKIMTIEDPIEYEQPLMVQTEIRRSDDPNNDLSFARVLRSILRQDPDIIFVGEIRDSETAGIAVQAAQTGHLLLSTLHTNSAFATISRLMDLNVPPYLIGESLRVVASQRLVGQPCPECSEEGPMPEAYAPFKGATMLQGTGVKDGAPCPYCHGTGDYKRLPVHEVLAITPDIRKAITAGDLQAIEALARVGGFRSLLEDGLAKVAAHKLNLSRVLELKNTNDTRP
ncbi:GspE/PulE family protein [Deinococcus ruber]|nr:GspE/PulE family protein [Deinococcus ruber]